MKRLAGAFVFLALAACQPIERGSGQGTLFGQSDMALPFEGGEKVQWRFPGEDAFEQAQIELSYLRFYSIHHRNTVSPGYEFIPVSHTPEEDYIVQIITPNEDDSDVSYFFVWRESEGYRQMWALESPLVHDYCRVVSGECLFTSRRDLLRLYERVFYPAFVQSDVTTR